MMAQFTLAQSYYNACKEERVNNFRKKLMTISSNGHLSLAIALGIELKLFNALAAAGKANKPASPLDVARLGGFLKPRYCFEWLCCMACGNIIEVDETGQNFWIPEENLEILTGQNTDKCFANTTTIPIFASVFKHILNLFKNDGPNGLEYSLYKDFYIKMNTISIALHKKHLIKDFIPLIKMQDALKKGIQVLDINCGAGFHMLEMAENFLNSQFIGVDSSKLAIKSAQLDAKLRNLNNIEFICADACELDAQWTEKFDLIMVFDSFHDQCRPDKALEQAYRCLNVAGLFIMVEINSTGNCFIDRNRLGSETSSLLYANSLFYCLPVGSNSEDALQLGTMWGVDLSKKMIENVGFQQITVEEISFYEMNILYKAYKTPAEKKMNKQSVHQT